MKGLLAHDRRLFKGDETWLIGVDEAGRGALAGPVMAGAVAIPAYFLESPKLSRLARHFNDSKQLSPYDRAAARAILDKLAFDGHLRMATGAASIEEIESENILGATRIAMRRALEACAGETLALPHPDSGENLFGVGERIEARVLVDGRPLRPFPYAHTAIIDGDAKSLVIAMASIAAKTDRDALMRSLHAQEPQYGFYDHKGYGTPQHWEALRLHGPGAHHRPSFLRSLPSAPDPAQGELFGS